MANLGEEMYFRIITTDCSGIDDTVRDLIETNLNFTQVLSLV